MTQVDLPAFTRKNVEITTGSFKHPSKPTNNQMCINYFPSSPGPDGRGKTTLLPTMGSQIMNTPDNQPTRFIKNVNGAIFYVKGNQFCSITINQEAQTATLTGLGFLNTTSGTVIGINNPNQLILMDGVHGYIYNFSFTGTVPLGTIGGVSGNTYSLAINSVNIFINQNVTTALSPLVLVSTINSHTGSTGVIASYNQGLLTLLGESNISSITVTESGTGFVAGINGITVSPGVFSSGSSAFSQFQQITDPNFVAGTHVVYIDGYFIVNNSFTQKFQFSQQNEGRIWNGLNVASAESKPSFIQALGETKGELWIFKQDSIEVWFDNANPVGSPFSKRIGSDIDIGCLAPYSVTNVNDLLVWVDSRGFIVQSDISPIFRQQSTGYTLTKISDEALDSELETYSTLVDAIACSYVDRGHIKYEITFPSANKTWVFDFNTQVWHERNWTNPANMNNLESSLMQYCTTYNGLLIGGSTRNSALYLFSPNFYTDGSQYITRIFTTAHYDFMFKQIGIDCLELGMETGDLGVENNAGYNENANIIMQFSNDSGFTWSNEMIRPLGNLGSYRKRILWNRVGSASRWLFLFKMTSPINHTILDITANVNIEQT